MEVLAMKPDQGHANLKSDGEAEANGLDTCAPNIIDTGFEDEIEVCGQSCIASTYHSHQDWVLRVVSQMPS